jgi:hypothetical protein
MVDFPVLAFVIIPAVMVVAVFVGDHIDKVNKK